jgi:DNA polymerase-4
VSSDGRTILHVDMDAFFAAVEVLVDPSLAGKAVIVGGSGARGVVASCSYEARAYGIHSAMPSLRARRLCPHAVFVQGRYDLYSDYSRRLHAVLTSFTPLVEGIALDEAFLDVTGSRRLFGDGPAMARAIRQQVWEDMTLTCSVGVASCKLLAKLASEEAKPKASLQGPVAGTGVYVVEPGAELGFLHPLPVRALWGVGPATAARLERFGVSTVGDLAAVPVESLVTALGSAAGRHLHELSWARDDRPVEPQRETKSIGHEETYAHDHVEHAPLRAEAVRMADAVAARLRRHKLTARTVVLKVRFHDFSTITRSHTFASPVDTGPVLARAAVELLDQVDVGSGVRLLGVTAANLVEDAARQLTLDEAAGWAGAAEWDDASAAVDAIRTRFGTDAVGPATSLGDNGLRITRRGAQQWGPDDAGDDR